MFFETNFGQIQSLSLLWSWFMKKIQFLCRMYPLYPYGRSFEHFRKPYASCGRRLEYAHSNLNIKLDLRKCFGFFLHSQMAHHSSGFVWISISNWDAQKSFNVHSRMVSWWSFLDWSNILDLHSRWS